MESRDKPPTSRDVAARAGVSQSTVSYVFSGKGNISEQTRSRVLRAAEELRYTVNLAARSMRTQRSGLIAVVIATTNWNLASVLDGATAAAHEAGYVIVVQSLPQAGGNPDQRLQEIVDSGQYEGVLSLAPIKSGDTLRTNGRTTLVALTDFDDDMRSRGELADPTPLVEIMRALAELGHRRFLHIAGDPSYPAALARRTAYEQTIADLGLHSIGIAGGDWTGHTAEAVIRELPDDTPPLAVIAANDLVATGAIRGALTRGWSVPGDISVTGWDDHSASAFLVPSLTTVTVDREELGRRSVRRLLAAMRNEPEPEPAGNLQHVIWRESTAPPRSR